jgi:hypothetical protein
MTDDEYLKAKVSSPLAERTLRSRMRLLLQGLGGAVVAHTHLIPNQIDGLGVVFSSSHQQSMLVIFMLSICYSLVSFSVSARADFLSSTMKCKAYVESKLSQPGFIENTKGIQDLRSKFEDVIYPLEVDISLVQRIQSYRFLLDIAVPLLVGVYGVASLSWYLYHAA